MITSRTKKQLLVFVFITLVGVSFVGARYAKLDRLVVHGHTRSIRPSAEGRRFGIDTGAFETGRLTALRIKDRQGRLLSS